MKSERLKPCDIGPAGRLGARDQKGRSDFILLGKRLAVYRTASHLLSTPGRVMNFSYKQNPWPRVDTELQTDHTILATSERHECLNSTKKRSNVT